MPLQSGDDGVLAAMMGRRYTSATYLRRVGLAEGFNLTADVIVGFVEDDAAFERTLAVVQEAGITKVHVFLQLAAPGDAHRGRRHGSTGGERASARPGALSAETRQRRWREAGAVDAVLVDRLGPRLWGRLHPWLVDAPLGGIVRAGAVDVSEEGVVGVPV